MGRPWTLAASRRTATAAALGAVLIAVQPVQAFYPRPGTTERISVGLNGEEPNGASFVAETSANGRFVALSSLASNLIPGDTNQSEDVFVVDRVTGEVERVSVAGDGSPGNDTSTDAAISADGRLVAFFSHATNLVPGDTNGLGDVFVHDRATGETRRVSISTQGVEGNESSKDADISGDGRFVVFESGASNLVPFDNHGPCFGLSQGCDVFVHELGTGTTERVSVSAAGAEANGPSGWGPAISHDGRWVTFYSFASNLVPGDTNSTADVFVKDRTTGAIERASVATDGAQGTGGSLASSVSDDGKVVAFDSSAGNLIPADGNRFSDVFVRDLASGVTERVSVSGGGVEGNRGSWNPKLSADGRFVTFFSEASNLAAGDANGQGRDVFVRDRLTGATELISGGAATGASEAPWISPNGRLVAFSSSAPLAPTKTGTQRDVFVRDRGPAVGVGALSASQAGGDISAAGWATFSGTPVAAVTDPANDGTGPATNVGAELTWASVLYRAEDESLLLRLGVRSLPGIRGAGSVPGTAGAPAILYGVKLTVGGTDYEVRAMRASAAAAAAPLFAVYRCAPSCSEVARLGGGIGTTGDEVVVSLPLREVGLSPDGEITGIRAYAAVGEAAGPLVELDAVQIGTAAAPALSVSLGVAPVGTPEDQVSFATAAALDRGGFQGTLDASSLPPGEYDVWARACLGQTCGAASARLS